MKQTINIFLHKEGHSQKLVEHSYVAQNIGNFLTSLEAGRAELCLLESCLISIDKTSYKLQLKKGLQFSDGSPLTAEDVVHCLRSYVAASEAPNALSSVLSPEPEGIRATSKHRLEIKTLCPCDDLLERFSVSRYPIYKKGQPDISSGKWNINQNTQDALLLIPVDSGHEEPNTPYIDSLIREAPKEGTFDYFMEDEAYAFIYPGIARPSPASALTFGHTLKEVGHGYVLLAIPTKSPLIVKNSAPLLKRAMTLLSRHDLYRLNEWHGLFPEDHDLYAKLDYSSHSTPSESSVIHLSYNQSQWDRPLLQHLVESGKSVGLDIVLSTRDNSDATLVLLPLSEPADNYSTLESMLHSEHFSLPNPTKTTLINLLKDLGTGQNIYRIRSQLKDFCSDLGLLPLAQVPEMLRSNRLLHRHKKNDVPGIEFFKSSAEHLERQELQNATLTALGSAVQLFAHDVKKPFSMIQGYFNLLANLENPEKIQSLAQKFQPDIRRTLQTVDRLLADLMEAGGRAIPAKHLVDLTLVLNNTFEEIFAFGSDSITLEYDLKHENYILGDSAKIQRALGNIIANARDAMKGPGKIWFKSQQIAIETEEFIQLIIGNQHSYIEPELCKRIFDLFYTEGKKTGTGLGLAIVKKIIEAHGGSIQCRSQKDIGTEFIMTLPSGPSLELVSATTLPKHSIEVSAKTRPHTPGGRNHQKPQGTLKVLMVDDEPLYGELVQSLVDREGYPMDVIQVNSGDMILPAFQDHTIDAILLDLDLGPNSKGGLEILRDLRSQGQNYFVAIHSAHLDSTTSSQLRASGANAIFAKPLTTKDLHHFISLVSKRHLPRIIVIDDDPFFLESIREFSSQLEMCVETFEDPQSLIRSAQKDQNLIRSSIAIVTDLYFGNEQKGRLVAQLFGKQIPVFVASDLADYIEDEEKFAGTLSKDPEEILEAMRGLNLRL